MLKQIKTVALFITLLPITGTAAQTCNPNSIPATTPASQFTDNRNGTVTDKKTGLMWKRCSEGQIWNGKSCTGNTVSYTWQGALQQAQAGNVRSGFASKRDWRLPNVKELHSIVERQCDEPAIRLTVFPNTLRWTWYWSSSPRTLEEWRAWTDDWAWYVNFGEGSNSTRVKSDIGQVRLVRSGL